MAALKEDREQEIPLLSFYQPIAPDLTSLIIVLSRARRSQERVRLPAAIHSEAGNFAARINELCN